MSDAPEHRWHRGNSLLVGGLRKRAIVLAGAVVLLLLLLAAVLHRAAAQAELVRADPDAILADARLRDVVLAAGADIFRRRCAACHGADGRGQGAGMPDLTDHDWLYGEGHVAEIEGVVRYGIRSRHPKGWNLASMPAYASERPYAAEPLPALAPRETEDVVQLLLADEGRSADPVAVTRGRAVYAKAGCWDCHGPDGRGDSAIGAPNLRDGATLYGGSAESLRWSVERGRRGVSPAFAGRLSPFEIRAVAVYAASLSRRGTAALRTAS